MALKEYIGISRLTQAFTLLKGIFDTKEDTPEQITKQQWDALTPAQQESGDYIVIGLEPSPSGGGGGHTIQNKNGTDLTQRDTLQFKGGLKVTDDSTNEKTVVDDTSDEITWTQYNNLTPAQQSALDNTIVTDVPGADGTISADLLTKLWENPSPTSAFAAQSITLSSGDYDFLLVTCIYSTDGGQSASTIVEKGKNINASINTTVIDYRDFTRNSDTSYTISDGRRVINNQASTNNNICIPLAIYGIKKTVTVKFDALARDVSTSASKCMMSDGVTSVEDAIDELNADIIDRTFHVKNVPIAGTIISNYYGQVSTGLDTTKYKAIGLSEAGIWDENVNFTIHGDGSGIHIRCIKSSYTIPNNRSDLSLIYVSKNAFT